MGPVFLSFPLNLPLPVNISLWGWAFCRRIQVPLRVFRAAGVEGRADVIMLVQAEICFAFLKCFENFVLPWWWTLLTLFILWLLLNTLDEMLTGFAIKYRKIPLVSITVWNWNYHYNRGGLPRWYICSWLAACVVQQESTEEKDSTDLTYWLS